MKCPKCGNEIKKDYVYCSVCGYSIQIVPDYEPDIEETIEKSRGELAGKVDELLSPGDSRADRGQEEEREKGKKDSDRSGKSAGAYGSDHKRGRSDAAGAGTDAGPGRGILVAIIGILLVTIAALSIALYTRRETPAPDPEEPSYASLVEEAEELINKDPEEAIELYEKAFRLYSKIRKQREKAAEGVERAENTEDAGNGAGNGNESGIREGDGSGGNAGSSAAAEEGVSVEEVDERDYERSRLTYARLLSATGRITEAESVYRLLHKEHPNNREICSELISIYLKRDDYKSINKLVSSIEDKDTRREFSGYVTVPVEFSRKGGTYEETFELVLSAEYMGKIYYTLDGSRANRDSLEYSRPLEIMEGTTVVHAVFVNMRGMSGEESDATFIVNYAAPDPPVVSPSSGNYSVPEYISVKVPKGLRCFYTTDGSTPTSDSQEYDRQLPMSLGSSTYSFVFLSDKNVYSEVTSVRYKLSINSIFSAEDAINYVTSSLVQAGALQDIYGNVNGSAGHYSYVCTKAASGGSRIYFLVEEYFTEAGGAYMPTGTTYAVDANGGMIYRARRNSGGTYDFTIFF